MKVYEIKVEKTGEYIRDFAGDVLLDLCLSTWTRIKGRSVIAVLKEKKEETKVSRLMELEELYTWLKTWARGRSDVKTLGTVIGCYDTKNLEKLRSIHRLIRLGDELYTLQMDWDSGLGIPVIREIALELYRQDPEEAKQLVSSNWHLICKYPQIANWIRQEGFFTGLILTIDTPSTVVDPLAFGTLKLSIGEMVNTPKAEPRLEKIFKRATDAKN